jgi:hypothetical protein
MEIFLHSLLNLLIVFSSISLTYKYMQKIGAVIARKQTIGTNPHSIVGSPDHVQLRSNEIYISNP